MNHILFEDDDIVAFLPEESIAPGHILVSTKEKYDLIDNVPDYLVAWCFAIGNKISQVLFDTIKMQGMNHLINSGLEPGKQWSLNLIPRFENDGLELRWDPKKGDMQELQKDMATYQGATKNKIIFEEKTKPQPIEKKKAAKIEQKEGEVNYLIKQLHRIP